jgi:hypothetical protein
LASPKLLKHGLESKLGLKGCSRCPNVDNAGDWLDKAIKISWHVSHLIRPAIDWGIEANSMRILESVDPPVKRVNARSSEDINPVILARRTSNGLV